MPTWGVNSKGDGTYETRVESDDAHVNGSGDLVFGRRRGNDFELVAAYSRGTWRNVTYIERYPLEEKASSEPESVK